MEELIWTLILLTIKMSVVMWSWCDWARSLLILYSSWWQKHADICTHLTNLTFPTYSGSVPVYSSTTKNWFQTHPLLTRSSDEAPCSCLFPPEVEPLVLETSHHPKLQQPRRLNAANSVQAPAVQEGAILIKNRSKEKKRKISGKGLHVI